MSSERKRRHRWLPRRLVFGGLVLGVAAFWMSLTPTLLPRGPVFQGLVSGGCVAIGYGLGVLGSWTIRGVVRREPSAIVRRVAWWTFAVVGAAGTLFMLLWFREWEHDLRALMGAEPLPSFALVVLLLVAVVTFSLLLGASRGLRLASRGLGRLIGKVAPPRVSALVGAFVVIALVIGLLNGVVVSRLMDSLNSTFKALNHETDAGSAPPTAPEMSGSSASLVTWDSLGRTGRNFIATGPTTAELQRFSGQPAKQPIRAYVGLASAGGIDAEAALAVRELERTGAFDRAVLAVATTTGTGWVNENTADSLEFLYNGDSAIVSMQYSYLPSWISFIVDQARAREAGKALFDAVYAKWSTLPADHRPKLVVFGESLGSFGGEAAFSGSQDLAARTDGALFVGPPNFNELWGEIVRHRDNGSPEWQPIYQAGETVRFAAAPADLAKPNTPWPAPRVVYLQQASDPIVWWSPKLLFKRPDWLAEPRGPDVLSSTRWIPVVTFLQVSADMAVADGVPPGHGHRYGANVADAWAAILQPDGWTAADTAKLRDTLVARGDTVKSDVETP